MLPVNQILQGSALERLKSLPDSTIDCCVTSPPYWALRDYKVEGQLGSEETPEEYLNRLMEIFREVKRVIKSTGSVWVNLGDTYDKNKSLVGIPERFAIMMTDDDSDDEYELCENVPLDIKMRIEQIYLSKRPKL